MARLVRPETLLGAPLHDVTETNLADLVTGGVREGADIDFNGRSTATQAPSGARSQATSLPWRTPSVVWSSSELRKSTVSRCHWCRSRSARRRNCGCDRWWQGNAAPHAPFSIHRVLSAGSPDEGFYLLEVPRSPAAPHAVVPALTERARRRIANMVNVDGDSIAAAAAELGVGWHTANTAVAEYTDPRIDDPTRLDDVNRDRGGRESVPQRHPRAPHGLHHPGPGPRTRSAPRGVGRPLG